MIEAMPPRLKRKSNIRQVHFRMRFKMPAQIVQRRLERCLRSRGDAQHLGRARRRSRCSLRRFRKHQVRIHSAHAEGADPGDARAIGPPRQSLAAHIKRRGRKIDARIRLAEVGNRRNCSVPHGQHGLDQPADSRRRVQMPNVGLDAAQRAKAVALSAAAERTRQPGDLHRIAKRRRRSVRLHIRDLVSADSGHGLGRRNHRRLAIHARSHVADLRRSVIVHCKAANNGVDPVAIQLIASSRRFSSTTPAPCPKTVPVASASNGRQRPSREPMLPS
jgi:hypothetical protein